MDTANQSYAFPSEERLKSRKCIESLFREAATLFAFPFRIHYQFRDDDAYPVRIAFAIPARKIRHATDRNKIRRRAREAWRLQHHPLISDLINSGKRIELILIFAATPADTAYPVIYKGITKAIRLLRERI